jgi:hypothetical protein
MQRWTGIGLLKTRYLMSMEVMLTGQTPGCFFMCRELH